MVSVEQKTTNQLIKIFAFHQYRSARSEVRVLILHKDYNATAPASVNITIANQQNPSAGRYIVLKADSIFSNFGLTYAGQTYDNTKDGMPMGQFVSESVQADDSGGLSSLGPADICDPAHHSTVGRKGRSAGHCVGLGQCVALLKRCGGREEAKGGMKTEVLEGGMASHNIVRVLSLWWRRGNRRAEAPMMCMFSAPSKARQAAKPSLRVRGTGQI